MARKDELKEMCDTLGLTPNKTRKRVDKENNTHYFESSIKDYEEAIQNYYLQVYKENGTLSPFMESVLKLDSPMLALQLKNAKKEVQDEVWKDNNDWILQEKLDGCFEYNTPIILEDGTTLPIGKIVEEKIKCNVLSYNIKTNKVESKPIINWFNNGKKNITDLIKYRKSTVDKGYFATSNHKFFYKNSYEAIENIDKVNTIIRMNKYIKQVIMGLCLGDSSILIDKRNKNTAYPRIVMSQSEEHLDFLLHIANLLEIDKSNIKFYISGYNSKCYRFTTKADINLLPIYDSLYLGYKKESKTDKRITKDYLDEMGFIGLAYWYMCDGSATEKSKQRRRATLWTNAYSLSNQNVIAEWFNSHNMYCSIKLEPRSNTYYIQFNKDGTVELFKKISQYIIDSMKYKISDEFKQVEFIDIKKHNEIEYSIYEVPIFKSKINKVNRRYYIMYDIEVEDNHNYFANNILVHNCRTLVCYDKKYGWDFYSRNKSVTDCLPISYKTKLLFPELDTTLLDQCNISSFIIDSELLPLYHTVNNMEDGTELVADTQLNLVTSILGSLDELSHKMQKTNPLKFVAFDLIMLNGTFITELPLHKRDSVLNGIVGILSKAGLGNRIEKVQATKVNKQDFYNKILMLGGEGCLAKEINSKYDYSGKRGNDWIKLKRTVSQSLLMEKVGDTIDGFVTGFKPGNVGTANEGLVGALELSVYLTDDNDEYLLDENGNPIVHHIATVSGITQELRNLVSAKDENGNPILDLRFYGKVATIDGQDISSKNYRFAHATFQGWRPDRDSESCKFRKSLLERLVL